jgi:hypothetical protein
VRGAQDMPNSEPIKQYVNAILALKGNQPELSSSYLARSLGSKKVKIPPLICNNVQKLLKSNTLANDAVLKILSTEVSKRS